MNLAIRLDMIKKIRGIILILGDVLAAYLSLLLTLCFGFWGKFSRQILASHLFPFTILYFAWLIIFYIFDLYELNLARTKLFFYPRLLGALVTGGLLGTILFYLIPGFGITPKTNLVLNLIIFGALVLLWRKIFYSQSSSRLRNNVAILGQTQEAKKLAKEILARPYLGYTLRAIFKTGPGPFTLKGIKTLKASGNLFSKIQKQKIDTLIVAEVLKPKSAISKALYQCLPGKITILDLSKAYEIICGKIPLSFVGYTWFLENLREGEKVIFDKIKRIFDLVLAGLLLVVTLPCWALIALAIKLQDKGTVFYKQKRVGKDRSTFLLIKFRSMKEGAEKEKGPVFAEKDDPRITKVGKFLRRTHLDELPQILNVLKGDISLVGPRPERPEFVQQLEKKISHYHLRHLIKPGLTGWAQIKFKYARNVMDSFEKFQYDLYYQKNRNIFLDIGILLKTFQLLFRSTQ